MPDSLWMNLFALGQYKGGRPPACPYKSLTWSWYFSPWLTTASDLLSSLAPVALALSPFPVLLLLPPFGRLNGRIIRQSNQPGTLLRGRWDDLNMQSPACPLLGFLRVPRLLSFGPHVAGIARRMFQGLAVKVHRSEDFRFLWPWLLLPRARMILPPHLSCFERESRDAGSRLLHLPVEMCRYDLPDYDDSCQAIHSEYRGGG